MDILQFCINTRDKLRRQWYRFKARRAMNQALRQYERMTTEQREAHAAAFAAFVDAVAALPHPQPDVQGTVKGSPEHERMGQRVGQEPH